MESARKKKTAAKGHGLNGQQILLEELEHFHDFISSLAVELGYPYNHRKTKRYSADFDSYLQLWIAYTNFSPPESGTTRRMKKSTFMKYLRKVYPDFALQRAKEDECDTCIRLKIIIADTRATEEEREEARKGLVNHSVDSRTMRVAMQTAIAEYGKKIIRPEADNGVMELFTDAVMTISLNSIYSISEDLTVEVLQLLDCNVKTSGGTSVFLGTERKGQE
jgi:hypothetical protein